MRADFHVHQPAAVSGKVPYRAADYVAFMDSLAIDLSVILPMDGLWHDPPACNDRLLEWCSEQPGRLVPFCTVDPRRPGAADELERCVRLGCRGAKFHNWLQGFSPMEPFFQPVMERAAALGIPVLFHDGTPPYSSSLQIAWLAGRHPDLKVVLGHGGLHDLWPEAIAAGRRYPNVYLCLCATPPLAMEQVIARVPAGQILFGTDGGLWAEPLQPYVAYRFQEFESLQADAAVKAQILGENALRLLGLPTGR